jgi:archaellum component FlaC
MNSLVTSEDFMRLEGRLENELRQMRLDMHKKEDQISEVSAQFEKIKDSVEKLSDLKISFKRFENTFGSNFGILSHDLDNLKTAFELLKMTSISTYKGNAK